MGLNTNQSAESDKTKTEQWFDNYIATGNSLESVTKAGYDYKDEKSRQTIARQQLDKYSDKILEATKKHIAKIAPDAVNTLVTIMQDTKQAGSNRITAAKAVAAYSGLDVQRTEDMTPNDARTDKQLQDELINLVKDGNMAPELMQAFRIAINPGEGADVIPMKANG